MTQPIPVLEEILPLILKQATFFLRQHRSLSWEMEKQDLCSEGVLVYYRAAKRFRADRGTAFQTFFQSCFANRLRSILRGHNRRQRRVRALVPLEDAGLHIPAGPACSFHFCPPLSLEAQQFLTKALSWQDDQARDRRGAARRFRQQLGYSRQHARELLDEMFSKLLPC